MESALIIFIVLGIPVLMLMVVFEDMIAEAYNVLWKE